MIKGLLLILVFLLVLNTVNAGQLFPINFQGDSEQTLKLAEKEAVEFVNYGKAVIILDDILEAEVVRIKVILDTGKSWGIVNLEKSASYSVDVQRDNIPDLVVINQGIKNNKAVLVFKSLEFSSGLDVDNVEQVMIEKSNTPEEITGKAVEQQKQNQLSIGPIVAVIIIIVGLLAFFFLTKGKK